jgi:polyisoprenoid-binding protein YceI
MQPRSPLAPRNLLGGLALAVGLLAAAPASAQTSSWSFDAAHTRVGFAVRHMVVSTVRGHFTKYEGSLTLDEKDVTRSKVDITIDTASVDTDVAKRDDHLRSPDFFDVAKFPKMTFASTKVEKAGSGLKVTGNLTLHGVTKPVVLEVSELTAEVKDPYGNLKRGATATAKINRKDFGLAYNAVLEAGGVAIGEEVTINLDVELDKVVKK